MLMHAQMHDMAGAARAKKRRMNLMFWILSLLSLNLSLLFFVFFLLSFSSRGMHSSHPYIVTFLPLPGTETN